MFSLLHILLFFYSFTSHQLAVALFVFKQMPSWLWLIDSSAFNVSLKITKKSIFFSSKDNSATHCIDWTLWLEASLHQSLSAAQLRLTDQDRIACFLINSVTWRESEQSSHGLNIQYGLCVQLSFPWKSLRFYFLNPLICYDIIGAGSSVGMHPELW